jgi:hypothetical protein
MYEVIASLFFKGIEFSYKWLNENMLAHILAFSKEFGAIIVFISAVIFLLIAVYLVMKQARRLPSSYIIETFDTVGNQTIIPELRVKFSTYQAAASYAQFYASNYRDRYKFKVVGMKDKIPIIRSLPK